MDLTPHCLFLLLHLTLSVYLSLSLSVPVCLSVYLSVSLCLSLYSHLFIAVDSELISVVLWSFYFVSVFCWGVNW